VCLGSPDVRDVSNFVRIRQDDEGQKILFVISGLKLSFGAARTAARGSHACPAGSQKLALRARGRFVIIRIPTPPACFSPTLFAEVKLRGSCFSIMKWNLAALYTFLFAVCLVAVLILVGSKPSNSNLAWPAAPAKGSLGKQVTRAFLEKSSFSTSPRQNDEDSSLNTSLMRAGGRVRDFESRGGRVGALLLRFGR
jgi:hypothetical protein